MKINEYKNDVGSLKLTQEFKDNLKAMMAEEYEKQKAEPEKSAEIQMSRPALFAKKYSKYAALAACLLIAVSTVGVMSLTRLTKSSDKNASEIQSADLNTNAPAAAEEVINDMDSLGDDGGSDATARDIEAPVESLNTDEGENYYDADEATNDDKADTVNASEEDEPAAVADSNPCSDLEEPASTVPMTGNGYSPAKSSDYDGDYDGEMYVAYNVAGNGDITASNVAETISINAVKISPTQVSEDEKADVETPADTTSAIESAQEFDGQTFDFGDLTDGYSVKYYDVRDGKIADLDNVALIRFRVLSSLSGDEIAQNIDREITVDPQKQTLYKINVGYDYFEREDPDVNLWMINSGNYEYQLIGRPVMNGEYIAVATMNNEGVVELIPELIYAVHNVSGLDIAYHVYSDDGFMIDPGNTNMGIMPEEVEFMTTTSNNPEVYTQKAAVRELTSYLRRNILRMEPTLTVLEDYIPQNEQPTESEQDDGPLDRLTFKYYPGRIVYSQENNTLNGVGEGMTLEEAVGALGLSKFEFRQDCVLTLIAADEDGGWTAVVTVTDGIVSKIEYKE